MAKGRAVNKKICLLIGIRNKTEKYVFESGECKDWLLHRLCPQAPMIVQVNKTQISNNKNSMLTLLI